MDIYMVLAAHLVFSTNLPIVYLWTFIVKRFSFDLYGSNTCSGRMHCPAPILFPYGPELGKKPMYLSIGKPHQIW